MHSFISFKKIYLLSLALIGIGYISMLPIFEGFDENAHFSLIKQIADTRSIPIYGKSYLSQQISNYQGPIPYSSLEPPFDNGLVYRKFFNEKNHTENYSEKYRNTSQIEKFEVSSTLNWQAQHPPLYYIVLAPVMTITEKLSLVNQVFILRLLSYSMALVGISLGMSYLTKENNIELDRQGVLGFIMYPIVIPMFFLEFTRIGNDSLCILLVGILAKLLHSWFEDELNKTTALLIGTTLGLGLLTKAFFIPITLAFLLFSALRIWTDKKNTNIKMRCLNLLIAYIPIILIGGAWHIYNIYILGVSPTGNDAVQLAQQGGFLHNFQINFSTLALIKGILVPIVTFSWGGTWSLARPPVFLQIPLLLLLFWISTSFFLKIKKLPAQNPLWLSVWMIALFFFGFFWHILISIAINGNGNTPGWYLHILAPIIAPLLGIGITRVTNRKIEKTIINALIAHAVAFQIFTIWSQITLFTGCSTKGNNKTYLYPNNYLCLDQLSTVYNNLTILAWPKLAFLSFLTGGILYIWMLKNYKKTFKNI